MSLDKILGETINAAKRQIKPSQDDYILDGLLHCKKCGTPKQCRIRVCGREKVVMCLCKCATENRNQESENERKQRKLEYVKKLRKMGFPDEDVAKCTFANDDKANKKATKLALRYYQKFDEMLKRGKGLLMFGNVGSGKTFLAACIANALIDKGYACLVTNFARLTNTLGGMYEGKQDYIDGLNKFDLLVIDDLAAERDTEYMSEIVQNIIDSRYRSGKPVIITTNLAEKEIYNPSGIKKQRTYSRIVEMCFPAKIEFEDRRKKKAAGDMKEIGKILGV